MSTWDEVSDILQQAIWRYTRGGTLQHLMATIQGNGSIRDAAKLAGVDRRTWQRWNTGSKPKPATLQKLRNVASAIRSPRMAALRPSLDVTSRYTSRTERRTSRTLDAKGLNWRPGFMATVMNHHNRGDHLGAAEAFIRAIDSSNPDGSAFYRDWLNPDNDDDDQGFDLDNIRW